MHSFVPLGPGPVRTTMSCVLRGRHSSFSFILFVAVVFCPMSSSTIVTFDTQYSVQSRTVVWSIHFPFIPSDIDDCVETIGSILKRNNPYV